MHTVKGDLITLAGQGWFDVIVHGANCFHTFGAGIASTIKNTFPAAYEADLNTNYGDKDKMGDISYATVQTDKGDLIVVNGYTQFGFFSEINADYDAIRGVFQMVKILYSGKRIGYPAIGAGLGGGDWEIISKIIEEELEGEDHTFVQYQP